MSLINGEGKSFLLTRANLLRLGEAIALDADCFTSSEHPEDRACLIEEIIERVDKYPPPFSIMESHGIYLKHFTRGEDRLKNEREIKFFAEVNAKSVQINGYDLDLNDLERFRGWIGEAIAFIKKENEGV